MLSAKQRRGGCCRTPTPLALSVGRPHYRRRGSLCVRSRSCAVHATWEPLHDLSRRGGRFSIRSGGASGIAAPSYRHERSLKPLFSVFWMASSHFAAPTRNWPTPRELRQQRIVMHVYSVDKHRPRSSANAAPRALLALGTGLARDRSLRTCARHTSQTRGKQLARTHARDATRAFAPRVARIPWSANLLRRGREMVIVQ